VIVVDANVIAYFYLPSRFSEAAEELHQREPHWSAPVLWRSEFRNVLAVQMRRGTMTLQDASNLQTAAENLLANCEYHVDSTSVLELARESGCSAYDCEYIALAIDLDAKLVTMDAKLLRSFPQRTLSLT
jgi:predicted nucleic acid-binding protein